MPAISFQSVSKTYRSARGTLQALDQVSFDIEEGEFFGLLGPNGAGKTTSFYMIVGLVRSDAGVIRIDGAEVQINGRPGVYYPYALVGCKFLYVSRWTVGAANEGFLIDAIHLMAQRVTT